jgi:hypothetical protein
MKVDVAPLVSFGMLMVAMACSPVDGPLGSSSEKLTSAATATYPNLPIAADHFGTMASVAVPDPACSAVGVNQVRTAVAWEEEEFNTTDVVETPIWFASQCGFNPITVGNGGNAQPLTTAVTGTPPEWANIFPNDPMIYSKEPILLPISHFDQLPTVVQSPGQTGWIVMVAQVGRQVGEFDSIAIVLSTDGGQTWHDPHLITDVGFFSGGGPQVDDLAATNSFREDKCDGTYECSPNAHCPTNDCSAATNDILVTWTWGGKRFFNYVSYFLNADKHWNIAPNPPNNPQLIQHIGTLPPFNQMPENALLNMSIVAGEWAQAGAIWPFVTLEWPAQSNRDVDNQPTLQVPCFNQPPPAPIPNQVWHVATSYFGTGPWVALPDSHPTTNYPLCVGADSGGAPNAYRNDLRASLAYDPGSHSVIDAVAVPNPSPSSAPGTVIMANAFQFNTPPGGVTPPMLVFQTTHASTGPQQDQFLPVIKGQEFAAPSTGLAIAYVDSIEDPNNQNRPSGVYGANADGFDPNNPNDVQPCNSPSVVTNCWWFGPSFGRIWPVPPAPAAMLAGPVDEIGRHNSLATWSGEFFLAYGGVFNGSAIVGQTTSIWPQ